MSDLIQRLENRGTYDDAYGLSDWAVAEAFRALTAERDALALQVQRARDDALKEAANRLRMFGDLGGMDIVMSLRCATEGAGG
jgi:hypothetical protein